MLRLLILALCACALAACGGESEAPDVEIATATADARTVSEFSGVITVVDGDTIRMGDRRIRFDGIDAPEQGARCGELDIYRASADALREITRSNEVRCAISGLPDQYDRLIARCSVGDVDLNEHMVRQGWARDWPRYSAGAYADEEALARSEARGVWNASCPATLWGERDYSGR